MSTLEHAREAKRLVRERFGADPRVVGVGITRDTAAGYTVEVRLASRLDVTPPGQVRSEIGGDTAEVPVSWRVTGPVRPSEA
ncbi:hypothetical protein FHX37_1084 [Haloactinospora alba]|uniref:Uncharacterized protein n=1 Tax=Haloactinospora alba TaxID=405555 RepID=A0A543NHG1_9ACTN|nr:hypothetical protein [Haloactinospora alba]TQN31190.1 hypothetical protein FHX37_1084 [Haloactinospora alba]